ncbi:hypothetical protein ACFV6F_15000 [Kitasatospora phosalacinea]|uniref:hypothetical protein n=1 Tax=Kitasatospora phosalacinea TaxID=2065 RepID=UPI00365205EC
MVAQVTVPLPWVRSGMVAAIGAGKAVVVVTVLVLAPVLVTETVSACRPHSIDQRSGRRKGLEARHLRRSTGAPDPPRAACRPAEPVSR